jgi:ribose/xylose/arabinose/galactoside ABC-type transport system permease subunit
VPAIVVTLGTMSLYRGMTSLLAGGRQIGADQVPQAWLDLTSQRVVGIPVMVIRNGLILVRVDPLWLQGVYGLVILVAITIDALVARRSRVSVRSRTA